MFVLCCLLLFVRFVGGFQFTCFCLVSFLFVKRLACEAQNCRTGGSVRPLLLYHTALTSLLKHALCTCSHILLCHSFIYICMTWVIKLSRVELPVCTNICKIINSTTAVFHVFSELKNNKNKKYEHINHPSTLSHIRLNPAKTILRWQLVPEIIIKHFSSSYISNVKYSHSLSPPFLFVWDLYLLIFLV